MRFKTLSSAVIMALAGAMFAAPTLNASDAQHLAALAEQGDVDAQRRWGEALLSGRGSAAANPADGIVWLERAAAAGDPRAHFLLYQYYVSLSSAPSVNQSRKHHLQQAATLGHPLAQAYLAEDLIDRATKSRGSAEARNRTLRTALRLLELSASAKSEDGAYANLRLADLFFEGRVVTQSDAKGLALLRRAAARGEPLAHYRIAAYHLRDAQAPQYSLSVGLKALQAAAEGGYPDAVIELAERHMLGDGVERDLERAAQWAARGASANDPAAIDLLQEIRREQDSARVRAAEKQRASTATPSAAGQPGAAPAIAPAPLAPRALALNHGVEAPGAFTADPDPLAAANHTSEEFRALREENRRLQSVIDQQREVIAALSSQRDSLIAQLAHLAGKSTVGTAEERAAEVLAQQGMQALASKDYTRAAALFGQAGKRGHATAWNNLGILYSQGWGLERDPGAALRSFKRAADLGEAKGAFNIAYMYRVGRGVRLDIDRAIHWYQRAADLGSGEAARYLASWSQPNASLAAR